MKLDSISSIYPWQQQQWRTIVARFHKKQMPHALLFTGLQGLGKLHFAKCLAEFLLCGNANDSTCGECHACQLLRANTHPDLLLIQPEEVGKAIKVEQIRQLVGSMAQTSQQGKYKIVIIEPADAMNIAAANALLKTLEEPSGKVMLMLVTHHPTLLPATVRSRCQNIIFTTTANDRAEQIIWLQEQLGQDIDAKQRLEAAEWAPLKVLMQHEQGLWQQEEKILQDFERVLTGNMNPIKFAAAYVTIGAQVVLQSLEKILHDALCLHNAVSKNYLLTQDKINLLKLVNSKITQSKLLKILDRLLELKRLLSRHTSLNQQLLLESFLISIVPSTGSGTGG